MSSPALRPWWRHPGPLLALAVHAGIFFGFFQLHFETGAWKQMEQRLPAEPTTKDWFNELTRQHGYWGVVIWFFDTRQETRLYRRFGEVAVRGVDPLLPNDHPRQGRFRLYVDVPMEYQPGALLMFAPPALVARSRAGYESAFTVWCGVVYFATLLLGLRLVSSGSPLPVAAANRALWFSAIFLLCFGGIAAARFDHIVPLVCVTALLAFQRAVRIQSVGGFAAAGSIIAVGVLTKIVPGVMLPAMCLWLALSTIPCRWKNIVTLIAGFSVTLLALHAAFYFWWGDAYLKSYTYHLQRGLQIESTYSGAILAAHGFGQPYHTLLQFGACDLSTPFAGRLKALSPVLFLTLSAIVGARLWFSRDRLASESPAVPVLLCAILFLFAFLLTNKVLSPQYLLWLGPLCALAYAARPQLRLAMATLLLAAGVSQAIFPHLYDQLLELQGGPILLLNFRNALLLTLFAGLCWQLPGLLSGEAEGKNHQHR